MELGPIWRSMLRNKSGYVLIALQIAVTMAIMVNSVAIMQERARNMARPSGMDEANTFVFSTVAFVPDVNQRALIDADLDLIRNTPGVIDAIATNSFPLRQGGWSMGLRTEPGTDDDTVGTAIYFSDEHAVEAFGAEVMEGRNFTLTDIDWNDPEDTVWPASGIVTEALANQLFPEESGSVVGKTVYIDDNDPVEIIAVIDRLQAPWSGWERIENSMLVPRRRDGDFQRYVVRTEPGMRDQLMPEIEAALVARNNDRIVQDMQTMDEVRHRSYFGDQAMIKLLTFIVSLLTIITGLGIVGLASFSVSRRTRQIGIRRALGATREAIMRYFMIENLLVSVTGIVFGGVLAIALNMAMVNAFAIAPMDWYVIPVAMFALLIVGQVAVAGPARKATGVSPSIATRSS